MLYCFLMSFFSLKKYCNGKLLVFFFNSLKIMQFSLQTSTICRTIFVFLSIKGPERYVAQSRGKNPPEVRDDFLSGRKKVKWDLKVQPMPCPPLPSPPLNRIIQTKHYCSLVLFPLSAGVCREGWIVFFCATSFCVSCIFCRRCRKTCDKITYNSPINIKFWAK